MKRAREPKTERAERVSAPNSELDERGGAVGRFIITETRLIWVPSVGKINQVCRSLDLEDIASHEVLRPSTPAMLFSKDAPYIEVTLNQGNKVMMHIPDEIDEFSRALWDARRARLESSAAAAAAAAVSDAPPLGIKKIIQTSSQRQQTEAHVTSSALADFSNLKKEFDALSELVRKTTHSDDINSVIDPIADIRNVDLISSELEIWLAQEFGRNLSDRMLLLDAFGLYNIARGATIAKISPNVFVQALKKLDNRFDVKNDMIRIRDRRKATADLVLEEVWKNGGYISKTILASKLKCSLKVVVSICEDLENDLQLNRDEDDYGNLIFFLDRFHHHRPRTITAT